MNNFLALIKREFWEHRSVFITTPLVMMGLLLAIMVLGTVFFDTIDGAASVDFSYNKTTHSQSGDTERHIRIQRNGDVTVIGDDDSTLLSQYSGNKKTIDTGLYAIHSIFISTAFVVVLFYLLGALFNDRKDRSILFWKSMPVSELQTVTTKLLVGLILVPLVFTFASWSIQVVYSIAAMLLVTTLDLDPWLAIWPYLNLPQTFATQFGLVFVVGIWLLPLSAWVLTASAMAKRSPFMMATIPIVVISMTERVLFESNYFFRWFSNNFFLDNLGSRTGQGFDINLSAYLTNVLYGSVVTVILLTIAVWLRNNRFEIDI